MFYVSRNDKGKIKALHTESQDDASETLSANHPEVLEFLEKDVASDDALRYLDESDKEMIRVLEDLIDVLVANNIIAYTDLPPAAQQKLLSRQNIRDRLSDMLSDAGNIDV